jgi:hypothetical protein
MDAEAGEIGELISRVPMAGPLLITGPDAYILKDELEKVLSSKSLSLKGLPPEAPEAPYSPERMVVDSRYNTGKGKELLEIAKKNFILEKESDVLRGPEYLRRSDAELTLIP